LFVNRLNFTAASAIMLIIDGYNLLWAAQKQSEAGAITDIQLCHMIGRYLRLTNQTGQIIFDGIGPPDKSPFAKAANLEIIFSGQNTDADSIIEAKITADSAPKRLTVISSDQQVRKAAKRAKSVSIKSEQFYGEMIKTLARKRPEREPMEKRAGLDEAQTRQWLKYFELEQ